MHKKIARNKPLWAAMSAGDEQKAPNVRGFRALSAPRGQIRRDVRERTKIPPESAGDGRRGYSLALYYTKANFNPDLEAL